MNIAKLNSINNPGPRFLCEIPHTRDCIQTVYAINKLLDEKIGPGNWDNTVKEYHQDSTVRFEVKDEFFDKAVAALEEFKKS